MSASPPASERTDRLDQALARLNIEGHWKSNKDGLPPEPAVEAEPYLWPWASLYPHLLEAGEALGMDAGASRRTLRLCTPGVPGKFTSHTIHTSVQMIKPGEVAESHRHSIGAFRFVIQGSGGQTTVEGERFVMEPHDLVLTPQWTWHEHSNESGEPIIWIDGHDLPLLRSLKTVFFQPSRQHNRSSEDNREAASWRRHQAPTASPIASAPAIYKGRDAITRLKALGRDAHDPCDGRTLDYLNPVGGGPTLPTVHCRLHLLQSGESTRPQRRTSSSICHVVAGSGTTVAGDKTLRWTAGDIFVLPHWTRYHHRVDDGAQAILFSATDEPVLDALGHLRVERATDEV